MEDGLRDRVLFTRDPDTHHFCAASGLWIAPAALLCGGAGSFSRRFAPKLGDKCDANRIGSAWMQQIGDPNFVHLEW
jgi:hypothetical protein